LLAADAAADALVDEATAVADAAETAVAVASAATAVDEAPTGATTGVAGCIDPDGSQPHVISNVSEQPNLTHHFFMASLLATRA